jgi:hypothetical protein
MKFRKLQFRTTYFEKVSFHLVEAKEEQIFVWIYNISIN